MDKTCTQLELTRMTHGQDVHEIGVACGMHATEKRERSQITGSGAMKSSGNWQRHRGWPKLAELGCKQTSTKVAGALLLGFLVTVGLLCSWNFLLYPQESPLEEAYGRFIAQRPKMNGRPRIDKAIKDPPSYSKAQPNSTLPHHSKAQPNSTLPQEAPADGGLDAVLERVSMANKTLILTVINKPYAENGSMLDLFLQCLREGEGTKDLIKHLLIAAVDNEAFDKCRRVHRHCYRITTEGADFSGEQLFEAKIYIKMMWRRLQFIADVLQRGYNVVFTDTDILWLRNPLARLMNTDDDMQITCDKYKGQPYNISNKINAGFYFVRSNNRTIQLFDLWYKSKGMGVQEQDVIQKLQDKPAFKKLGLKFRFLDTFYFGGFCHMRRNIKEANTMHANCCRTMGKKLADLRAVFQAFKNFTSTDGSSSTSGWPYPKTCWPSRDKSKQKKKDGKRS
ncbi:Beta-arabinofuranosyltransferase [Nymphaea thermarum]|nr:Beta-arabinofuranosyltransferase [Nymphaea thermarum]